MDKLPNHFDKQGGYRSHVGDIKLELVGGSLCQSTIVFQGLLIFWMRDQQTMGYLNFEIKLFSNLPYVVL